MRWFADFKRRRTNADDAERSGRPNSAVVLHGKNKTGMVTVTNAVGARERKKIFKTVATE